ncbi:MAG: MFS transporter, partial [Byssovorax sp.]
ASKERFAREMLAEKGLLTGEALTSLKQGEAFDKLVELSHLDKWEVTHQLYATHNIGVVWYIMAAVGVVTAVGIYLYGRWITQLMKAR